jgi:hypothetical protein
MAETRVDKHADERQAVEDQVQTIRDGKANPHVQTFLAKLKNAGILSDSSAAVDHFVLLLAEFFEDLGEGTPLAPGESLEAASIEQIWAEVDRRTREGRVWGSGNIGSSGLLLSDETVAEQGDVRQVADDRTANDAGVTAEQGDPKPVA